MTSARIRWGEASLCPYELTFVPAGWYAVTDADAARQRLPDALRNARLPAHRAEHYIALWDSCLRHGRQESGLVVTCLGALATAVGLPSNAIAKQWSAWCIERRVWVPVPGRLYSRYPRARSPYIGRRSRAYLVIAPAVTRSESRIR